MHIIVFSLVLQLPFLMNSVHAEMSVVSDPLSNRSLLFALWLLQTIVKLVEPAADALLEGGQHVSVIISSDGLPDDQASRSEVRCDGMGWGGVLVWLGGGGGAE